MSPTSSGIDVNRLPCALSSSRDLSFATPSGSFVILLPWTSMTRSMYAPPMVSGNDSSSLPGKESSSRYLQSPMESGSRRTLLPASIR